MVKNEKKVTAGLQADTLNVRLFYVKRTTHIMHGHMRLFLVFSYTTVSKIGEELAVLRTSHQFQS
jgi:hypothetical protein